MDKHRFPITGRGPQVPPIPGFKHYLASNIRLGPELALRGLYVSRYQVDKYVLTISAACSQKPADGTPYLSVLSAQWVDPTGIGPSPGLVLQGDPFSHSSSQGTGKMLWNVETRDIPYLEKSGFLLALFVRGWHRYGILDGNHINLRKLAKFYEAGSMDRLVTAACKGAERIVIDECDPDSVSAYPDLDYETGLGIHDEPEKLPDPVQEPIAKIKEVLAPGRFKYELPSSTPPWAWIFYDLPKGEVISDIQKAIRYEEAMNPPLKQPTSGLLSKWPMFTRYEGPSGALYLSEPWWPDETAGVRTPIDLPACIYRTGWHGFQGIHLPEGFFVLRALGTYVYGSAEFHKLVGFDSKEANALEMFPDLSDSGWASIKFSKR